MSKLKLFGSIVIGLVIIVLIAVACNRPTDTEETPPAVPTLEPTLLPGDPNATPTPVVAAVITAVPVQANTNPAAATPVVVNLPPWALYNNVGSAYAKDGTVPIIVDRRHKLAENQIVCVEGSPNLTPVVNSGVRQVDVGEPQYISTAAYADFAALVAAAKAQGIDVAVRTVCRTFEKQEDIYNAALAKDPNADTYSLRPGHSLHHLGTTVIFTTNEVGDFNAAAGWTEGFADTALGKFLDAHGHEYGFVMPYGKDQECLTGITYSPWEWRWIGTGNAQTWYEAKQNTPALAFVQWLYVINGVELVPYCTN